MDYKNLKLILALGILLTGVVCTKLAVARVSKSLYQPQYVLAEDDENDERDEKDERDDDDNEDNEDNKSGASTEETVIYTQEVLQPATPTYVQVQIVAIEFQTDTDKDGLVDALDPNPTVDQRLFFTDSDNDGVMDASDQHSGENDLAYLTFEDANTNGILDMFDK
jgi:hypothetical protein